MSKPESIKIEPWTDFPRQPYTIIADDFVHDKLFVAKINTKSEKSTVNVKATISAEKDKHTVSDELKVWFSLPEGRSLYSKIKSNNYLKVHLDNGVTEQWGKRWNFYGSVNATKSIDNLSLRIGATHIDEKCHSDNRLKIQLLGENKHSFTFYNRTVATYERFTFGLLGAYSLTNNVLQKNNLLFGYKFEDTNKSSFFVRVQNNGYRKTGFNWSNWNGYFDQVKLDFISKFKDIKYGAQAILNTKGNLFNEATFVAQYNNTKNHTSKIRISSKFSAAVLYKYPSLIFKDQAFVSLGLHANDLLTDKRHFKYGAQVEFNV